MLIVSLDNLQNLSDTLYSLSPDVIEFRLDLFSEKDLLALQNNPLQLPLPLLVTLKPCVNLNDRFEVILKKLQPQFIDLDHTLFFSFEPICKQICPNARLIVSKHSSKSYDIKKFFKQFPHADFKKLVIDTDNVVLALKIAILAKNYNLILFTGGKNTSFTRFFSFWHYCCFKTQTAKGQFCLQTLRHLYGQTSQISQFLALIGDPVSHSLSDITHNYILKTTATPCIYLKIPLKIHQLQQGIFYLKKLGCIGLSITTPHKQKAFQYLTKKPYPKSINSWHFKTHSYTNTDTLALTEVLGSVKNKRSVLLLGDGACSKAFQDFFKTAKIPFYLWCRRNSPPLQHHYDVIINATSCQDPILHLPQCHLLINLFHHTQEPEIEKKAYQYKALVCGGTQFFFTQAEKQLEFFFNKKFCLDPHTLLSLVKVYKDR